MTSRREPTTTIVPIRAATPRVELWLYAGAALSYVVCGFFVKQIFAWWWFGAAWFVGFVWLVPKLWDRGDGRPSVPSGAAGPDAAAVDADDDSDAAR